MWPFTKHNLEAKNCYVLDITCKIVKWVGWQILIEICGFAAFISANISARFKQLQLCLCDGAIPLLKELNGVVTCWGASGHEAVKQGSYFHPHHS